MIYGVKIEICAGSYDDVIRISSIPAVDRIELNSAMESDGLTPSLSEFRLSRKASDKQILCMVRPRQAGFCYTESEKEVMKEDARVFLEEGADGIVFGSLNSDLTVDEAFSGEMIDLIHSYGKEAVFHKAFDITPDPYAAAKTLASLGIDRILTSGQKATALEGADLIRELEEKYGDRMQFQPGGSVRKENAAEILKKTGCTRLHFSGKETKEDQGSYMACSVSVITDVIEAVAAARKPTGQHHMTGEDIEMFENDSYEEKLYDSPLDDHDY